MFVIYPWDKRVSQSYSKENSVFIYPYQIFYSLQSQLSQKNGITINLFAPAKMYTYASIFTFFFILTPINSMNPSPPVLPCHPHLRPGSIMFPGLLQ